MCAHGVRHLDPGAGSYHVDLFDDTTGEALFRGDTSATGLVPPPLPAGALFQWNVSALATAASSYALANSPTLYFKIAR